MKLWVRRCRSRLARRKGNANRRNASVHNRGGMLARARAPAHLHTELLISRGVRGNTNLWQRADNGVAELLPAADVAATAKMLRARVPEGWRKGGNVEKAGTRDFDGPINIPCAIYRTCRPPPIRPQRPGRRSVSLLSAIVSAVCGWRSAVRRWTA